MLRQLPLLAQYLEESLRQDELRRIEEAEKAKLRYWGSGCVAAVRFLNLIWKYNELHGTPKMAILNPKIIFLGFLNSRLLGGCFGPLSYLPGRAGTASSEGRGQTARGRGSQGTGLFGVRQTAAEKKPNG